MKTYTYNIANNLVEIGEQEHAEILNSKKTFLLYTDTLMLMEDILETLEEKGLLLESIYCAQTGQELPDLTEYKHVAAVYKQLSKNWDIDNEKYIKTTLKNRQNLSKRGAVRVQEKDSVNKAPSNNNASEYPYADEDDDSDSDLTLPFE